MTKIEEREKAIKSLAYFLINYVRIKKKNGRLKKFTLKDYNKLIKPLRND